MDCDHSDGIIYTERLTSELTSFNLDNKAKSREVVEKPARARKEKGQTKRSGASRASNAVFKENRRLNAERYWAGRARGNRSTHEKKPWRQNAPTKQESSSNILLRDSKGRRLDPPLNPPSTALVAEVEKARYCNEYHLKGFCKFDRRDCKFRHEAKDERGAYRKLRLEEKEALRCLARRSFCVKRTSCDDPGCFASHRCPNHNRKPAGGRCSFPASMHFERSEPVNLPGEHGWGSTL